MQEVTVYNRNGAGNQPFCNLIAITKDAINMETGGCKHWMESTALQNVTVSMNK